jgi:hypothetical protein
MTKTRVKRSVTLGSRYETSHCRDGTSSDDRFKKAEAYRNEFASPGLPRCIRVNDREPLVISRPQRQHQAPTCLELFEKCRRRPLSADRQQNLVVWRVLGPPTSVAL